MDVVRLSMLGPTDLKSPSRVLTDVIGAIGRAEVGRTRRSDTPTRL